MRVPVRVRELALRLAREDALPGYVYDLGALDAHTARIRAALPPGVELYYAVKANPDPAVLRIVAGHADGLEVSSGGELRHVARVTPGRPLAFGGPGKSEAELAQAVRAAALLHVESPEELRLLAAVTRGRAVDVLLRANLAAPLRTEGELLMGGGPSPFGMDAAGLSQCAALLPGTELRLRGLHAHLASGLAVRAALDTAARVLRFARSWCARGGVRHPMITLGGGMAVDYRRPGTTFGWEACGHGLARQARRGGPRGSVGAHPVVDPARRRARQPVRDRRP
jgi:diaminopimelate decarboxylase